MEKIQKEESLENYQEYQSDEDILKKLSHAELIERYLYRFNLVDEEGAYKNGWSNGIVIGFLIGAFLIGIAFIVCILSNGGF